MSCVIDLTQSYRHSISQKCSASKPVLGKPFNFVVTLIMFTIIDDLPHMED